ncbi:MULTISPECIES: hypothetical protein [Pseudonocardia]|uniref:Uncharacterized protein n=2 Tax=Pseudonocardia TaxID=1847 RepID=A0A1Y2MMG2_PSEAH|nr:MULTISPECIES: hypothetical protein [Pseudonocardia]OSY36372.1 hypothetical protein BG845_05449 [Pseudonocardia autotrophica]TDN72672.1 hypothetical protein C8E95_1732 [Pseudonocardia autotrophica]BBG03384.1 hypothetical protein Pdca_45930 [Pseudonocardia autotrophica]GEC27261.1 hypothetical protein PSA01_42900 [Pseudonocardia saturnea]
MPPHRDWTRRGVGRALLYWPLVAFLLVAAFPAVAVPLVIVSGFGLLFLGLIGGFAGKRWRARRLARARRAVAELAEQVAPGAGEEPGTDGISERPAPCPAAWPTGRHARRPRQPHSVAAQPIAAAEEPAEQSAA